MADQLRAYNPTLRERLSALLQGDAKTGSVRQHLVHGLLGGSTDEGDETKNTPLVDMTPLGAVFAGQSASRAAKEGDIGKGLSAMAGMAGPEGKMGMAAASALIDAAGHTMTPEILEQVGKGLVDRAPGEVSAFLREKGLNPNSIKEALAHHAAAREALGGEASQEAEAAGESPEVHGLLDTVTGKNAAQDFKAGIKPRFKVTEQQVRDGQEPWQGAEPGHYMGEEEGDSRGPYQKRPEPARDIGSGAGYAPVDKRAVIAAAGGDPAKEHFIMQAMQDEGGNVPEEVAATLADHIIHLPDNHPKLGEMYDLAERHGALAPQGAIDDSVLASALAKNHSIPEMLAMHYDLDPKTMGQAYKMEQRAATSAKAKDLLTGARGVEKVTPRRK